MEEVVSFERRVYVDVEMVHQFAEAGVPLPWPDGHLPHGLHLNQVWVPVPVIIVRGPARLREILHSRTFMSPDLRRNRAYIMESPLSTRWFEAEHGARRQSIEGHFESLDDGAIDYEAPPTPSSQPPPAPVKEEEEEDDVPPMESRNGSMRAITSCLIFIFYANCGLWTHF
jgi:hypothetical protein